ncbi:hypothetical protein [Caballeronia sp. GAWG1-1]|uniref:hypothetical protein n=1 Tax=Caballeronia sp. GAWG1-1 TaxID=2921742 RepID=UPI002028FC64|nr:hypothetical protein [Caballeronia sp. GAWG1-1]
MVTDPVKLAFARRFRDALVEESARLSKKAHWPAETAIDFENLRHVRRLLDAHVPIAEQVSSTTVKNWLDAIHMPRPKHLQMLSKALNRSVNWLKFGVSDSSSSYVNNYANEPAVSYGQGALNEDRRSKLRNIRSMIDQLLVEVDKFEDELKY